VRDDRPFGCAVPPAAAFHYSRSRSGEHPREHLATYSGIMQADAYAGYNGLYDGRRRPAPVIEAACWSHSRRKLFDIAKLTKAPIAVERAINGRTSTERIAVRQQQSKPLILHLEKYLRGQQLSLSAKSDTSDSGGHRPAAIYTLIETTKLDDVDPQAWLADVLARLPDHPAKRLDELLPWHWKASRLATAPAQAA